MDIEKSFHMADGTGPTSYTRNSSLQKKGSDMVKHITMETLQQLYIDMEYQTSVRIADLGCSSGSNTLSIIKVMVEVIEGTSRKVRRATPEFHFYLNDLPTNDFNSVFKALPEFYKEIRKEEGGGARSKIYIAGYPGSFYGRLFPNSLLHFVYSSYSLHWLSKVPPDVYNEQGESINKGGTYISESSPPEVSLAYLRQFQDDFSLFLRSRSEEVVIGGRMVLILLGRVGSDHVDRGNSFLWQLLSRSLSILASKGNIEKEKLDSYEVHFYAPSRDEMEEEVRKEGSFGVEKFEMFEIEREDDGQSYGSVVAMTVRAIQESMIRHHFGLSDQSLDILFEIYGRIVDEEMAKQEIKPITFLLVLRKT